MISYFYAFNGCCLTDIYTKLYLEYYFRFFFKKKNYFRLLYNVYNMEVLYTIFFFFFTCPSGQIPISTTADPITKKS